MKNNVPTCIHHISTQTCMKKAKAHHRSLAYILASTKTQEAGESSNNFNILTIGFADKLSKLVKT